MVFSRGRESFIQDDITINNNALLVIGCCAVVSPNGSRLRRRCCYGRNSRRRKSGENLKIWNPELPIRRGPSQYSCFPGHCGKRLGMQDPHFTEMPPSLPTPPTDLSISVRFGRFGHATRRARSNFQHNTLPDFGRAFGERNELNSHVINVADLVVRFLASPA